MKSSETAHFFVGRTKKYAQSHISSIKTQVGQKFTTRRGTFVRDSIVHHMFDGEKPPRKRRRLSEKQQLLMDWEEETISESITLLLS